MPSFKALYENWKILLRVDNNNNHRSGIGGAVDVQLFNSRGREIEILKSNCDIALTTIKLL